MIRLLKFSDRAALARPLAARAAAFLHGRAPLLGPVDRIVPVPLPLLRRLRRGYNQSALLARELGLRLGIPVEASALGRRWRGRPQAGLPSRRRAGNVRGAFRVRRPGSVAGCRLLVVDDVWTTGATLAECSRALREAGARRVAVFSLARTPPAGGKPGC
jgi:ComF family protein